MLPNFKKIDLEDAATSLFQDNCAVVFQTIKLALIIDGVELKNVKLTTGIDNVIAHKLGRKYVGYWVIDKNGFADICTSTEQNNLADRVLLLNCSANVTVNLWVF